MNHIERILNHPLAPLLIIVSAVLMCSTSLLTGFFADDLIHYALMSPENAGLKPNDASLFGLFSFTNGDPERNLLLRDHALITWWTYDGLKYAFWRPISELTHWVDHRFWHDTPWLMHLHNLAWYGLLCSIVYRLYSTTLATRTAAIAALLLYALDGTHGFAVAWISNRNALVAATAGFTALWLHHTAITNRDNRKSVLARISFAIALLSAEAGVSTLGYLLAYAAIADSRTLLTRIKSLATYVAIFLGWWTLYKHLGFGAANADSYYVDPASNPIFFLQKVIERLPVMLASELGFLPAEIYGFAGQTIPVYVLVCGIFISVIFAVIWPAIRHRRDMMFWAVGMLFSLMPVLSALPHDRNLLFAGLGGSALIASIVDEWLRRKKVAATGPAWKTGAAFTLVLNALIGTAVLPVTSYLPAVWNEHMSTKATALPPLDASITNVILVGTPLAAALAITPVNFQQHKALPEKIWILATEPGRYTITRTDREKIRVEKDSAFVTNLEKSLRDPAKYPFFAGDNVKIGGGKLIIDSVNSAHQPTSLSWTFPPELAQHTVFAVWHNDGYKIERMPVQNETLILEL